MDKYWETIMRYWVGWTNCYGLIDAWVHNDFSKLKFLEREQINEILNTLQSTQIREILSKKTRARLYDLLRQKNEKKTVKFMQKNGDEIFWYIENIKKLQKENKDKILIIEFLDNKRFSQHVAFITPDMKVYDKVGTWKFNLWYDVKEMFAYWTDRSWNYKLYVLDEEQTKNVEKYLYNLECKSKTMNNK